MLALILLFAQIPTPSPQVPPNMTPQVAPPQNAPDAGVPPVANSPLPAKASPAAPSYEGLTTPRLQQIQQALTRAKIDGWLFYDFRASDLIAYRVLGLDPAGPRSRRWYCYVPARGQPQKLVHAIEPHALDGVPGKITTYSSWRLRDRELGGLLRGQKRVAMEYSPRNDLPTIAQVDAGTLELVRSLGPEVVSSADLVAELESTLTPEELASQARATDLLAGVIEATAQEAVRRVREGHPATEGELRDFAKGRMQAAGLTEDGPGVAVDAHSADPHSRATDGVAGQNSLLLLDFAARLGSGPHDIYADLTRVYFLGDRTPDEMARVAASVFQARDAAIAFLEQRVGVGKPPTGAEVDDVARAVIDKAGHGQHFMHRTGHSLGTRGHGDGVNNDNFETHDTRRHLPETCFSIEPGIYLPGRFGIRSEVDVCIAGGKVLVRGLTQGEVPALIK